MAKSIRPSLWHMWVEIYLNMAKWWNRHTQRTQNPSVEIPWGFNPLLSHQWYSIFVHIHIRFDLPLSLCRYHMPFSRSLTIVRYTKRILYHTTGDLESLCSIDWIVRQLEWVCIMKKIRCNDPDKNLRTRETSQDTLIMCVIKRNPGPMDVSQSLNTPKRTAPMSWNDIWLRAIIG